MHISLLHVFIFNAILSSRILWWSAWKISLKRYKHSLNWVFVCLFVLIFDFGAAHSVEKQPWFRDLLSRLQKTILLPSSLLLGKETETEKLLLIHFADTRMTWDWDQSQKPSSPMWVAGIQVVESVPAAFPCLHQQAAGVKGSAWNSTQALWSGVWELAKS